MGVLAHFVAPENGVLSSFGVVAVDLCGQGLALLAAKETISSA
jgi:hypothetical protein